MAKPQQKKVKKAEWKGYHKISLTKEQDSEFATWVSENPVSFDVAETLVGNGYKVSFSWDDYHAGISCSFYATDAKMDWAGFTLSSWGETMQEAFELNVYKHYIICNENWDVAKDVSERSYAKRG